MYSGTFSSFPGHADLQAALNVRDIQGGLQIRILELKSTTHKMHYLAVKPGLAKLMKHFNSQINRSKVNFVKVC